MRTQLQAGDRADRPRPRARSGSDWVPHRDDVFIEGYELFDGFTAIAERSGGLERLRLLRAGDAADGGEFVKADEPAYAMGLDVNAEPDTDWLRYSYTSLTTPATTYELNTRTGERRLLKRQPVHRLRPRQLRHRAAVGDRARWHEDPGVARLPQGLREERHGRDAAVRLRQLRHRRPIPRFNLPVVSLLDRGMVYAIAHIRGGQEMGRAWYDDGKLLHKKNTFTDFIDVTDFLVREGYAAKDRVAALRRQRRRPADGRGRQHGAGRLPRDPVAGAVRRRGHDHARRQHPADHQRIRRVGQPGAASTTTTTCCRIRPTTTSKAQAYPAMFVGTGLWDSQVQYCEPAKYVARLRDLEHVAACRCCSAPTWTPATAASPGASAATANWRRCMRSCSTSSAVRRSGSARDEPAAILGAWTRSAALPHRRRTAGRAGRLRQQGSAGEASQAAPPMPTAGTGRSRRRPTRRRCCRPQSPRRRMTIPPPPVTARQHAARAAADDGGGNG